MLSISDNAQQGTVTTLVYEGRTDELFGIWIINLLLKIVTLGIYGFWGKTRMRKYIAGSFSLLKDRFEYTGTGGELFRGFLKALPIILVLYAPFIIWPAKEHPLTKLMFIPIIYLFYAGFYAALRYRFSRLTWRGVRGKLTGSAFHYATLKMKRTVWNIITLGYQIPHSDILAQRYMVENFHFGSAKAAFDGNPSKLIKINIVTLLLAIPTLGFARIWYKAALMRHVYGSITINSLRLSGSMTASKLIGLVLGNALILLITIGLGMPFIIQRNMRYFANTLGIIGDIDTADIRQSDETLGTSGEGLDGILGSHDIGFL